MEIKHQELKAKKIQTRFLNELKGLLYDQKWRKTAKDFEVYYVLKSVKERNGLRYDITLMPPRMLGKEFPKTKGHCHKKNQKELYIVLEGKAYYLLQKGKENKVEDVYLVKAKKGEGVIILPGYHHLTINPSKKILKMGNWVSKKCQADYSLFEKMKGACYYYTKSGWIKNKNYKKIPKLKFKKPLSPVRIAKILKVIESCKFSNRVKKIPKNLNFLK